MMECPFFCFIPLGKGLWTQVDPEDWLLYASYTWRAKKCRGGLYAACRIKIDGVQRWFYLHRLIAHCPRGMITHHKDGVTLNNHRCNLCNMTPAEHDDLSKIRKIARRSQGVLPEH